MFLEKLFVTLLYSMVFKSADFAKPYICLYKFL